jgi:ABC-type bacteriocin/lantibiotic exporter with double-glycine peptidase domain
MTRAEFEAVWDGRLVLMTRRAGLVDLSGRFDITWFLGAIHKYRYLLSEVLVTSFFLQVFALISPLFFQVVIDKVLAPHAQYARCVDHWPGGSWNFRDHPWDSAHLFICAHDQPH